MRIYLSCSIVSLFLALGACRTQDKKEKVARAINPKIERQSEAAESPAQKLLNATISAHGGTHYNTAYYEFTFRDKKYTFKNANGRYRYTMHQVKDGNNILDSLSNGRFKRYGER